MILPTARHTGRGQQTTLIFLTAAAPCGIGALFFAQATHAPTYEKPCFLAQLDYDLDIRPLCGQGILNRSFAKHTFLLLRANHGPAAAATG
jgi:hypothetical protein